MKTKSSPASSINTSRNSDAPNNENKLFDDEEEEEEGKSEDIEVPTGVHTNEETNNEREEGMKNIRNTQLSNEIDEIDESSDTEQAKRKVSANSTEGKSILHKTLQDSKHREGNPHEASKKKSKQVVDIQSAKPINLFATKLVEDESAVLTSPSFDPSKFDISKYISNTKSKDEGGSILFKFLAESYDKIEALKGSGTGSKKAVVVLLTNVFRTFLFFSPQELLYAVQISLNKVAPEYFGLEVGVGEVILIRAMADVYSRSEVNIKKDLSTMEDLGIIAESSCCKVRTLFPIPSLTTYAVFSQLKGIAESSGQNSQNRKKDKIKRLLLGGKSSEPKYIIRFLQQKMRIGMQSATVFSALAFASLLTPPKQGTKDAVADTRRQTPTDATHLDTRLNEIEKALKAALCEVPNVEVVIEHLLKGANETTLPKLCVATPGIPVQPMLAKPTKGLSEVLDRFASCRFTCEFKYDGERAQLHMLEPGRFKVFSRNLEDITIKYPDVINLLRDASTPDAADYIIDSEVVAYDAETNKILPFQVLSTRKRKLDSSDTIKVQICVFPFDCIRYNGEVLLSRPLEERRRFLFQSLTPSAGKLQFAEHREMTSMEDMDNFLQDAMEANCEGLMVKTLDENASYEPYKRSLNWLKVKKDYIDSISDTVDLVPIGAFFGKGRRNGVYGAYLLAVYNDSEESFETICKLGTGFSDEVLQELFSAHKDKVLSSKKACYIASDKSVPNVWLDASQVWECRAADLSLSPVYTAGITKKNSDKGISLRFPRFLRIRQDKDPEQATSTSQILEMYENQFQSLGRENEDTGMNLPSDSDIEDE